MGRELAVLVADESVRKRLTEVAAATARGEYGQCRLSFRMSSRAKSRVAIIAYQGAVEFITGIDSVGRGDDIQWTFDFRLVTRLDNPIGLSRIRAMLKTSQRRPLDEQGDLTQLASEAAKDVLIDHQRSLGPLLDTLFAARVLDLPEEQHARLAQERDGIASIFAFTGFPNLIPDDGLLDENEIADLARRESFLPETQQGVPLEDPMVEHDANTFLGLAPGESDKLGVRVYTDGANRKLHVMSVNRWSIETRLGPDLIY